MNIVGRVITIKGGDGQWHAADGQTVTIIAGDTFEILKSYTNSSYFNVLLNDKKEVFVPLNNKKATLDENKHIALRKELYNLRIEIAQDYSNKIGTPGDLITKISYHDILLKLLMMYDNRPAYFCMAYENQYELEYIRESMHRFNIFNNNLVSKLNDVKYKLARNSNWNFKTHADYKNHKFHDEIRHVLEHEGGNPQNMQGPNFNQAYITEVEEMYTFKDVITSWPSHAEDNEHWCTPAYFTTQFKLYLTICSNILITDKTYAALCSREQSNNEKILQMSLLWNTFNNPIICGCIFSYNMIMTIIFNQNKRISVDSVTLSQIVNGKGDDHIHRPDGDEYEYIEDDLFLKDMFNIAAGTNYKNKNTTFFPNECKTVYLGIYDMFSQPMLSQSIGEPNLSMPHCEWHEQEDLRYAIKNTNYITFANNLNIQCLPFKCRVDSLGLDLSIGQLFKNTTVVLEFLEIENMTLKIGNIKINLYQNNPNFVNNPTEYILDFKGKIILRCPKIDKNAHKFLAFAFICQYIGKHTFVKNQYIIYRNNSFESMANNYTKIVTTMQKSQYKVKEPREFNIIDITNPIKTHVNEQKQKVKIIKTNMYYYARDWTQSGTANALNMDLYQMMKKCFIDTGKPEKKVMIMIPWWCNLNVPGAARKYIKTVKGFHGFSPYENIWDTWYQHCIRRIQYKFKDLPNTADNVYFRRY